MHPRNLSRLVPVTLLTLVVPFGAMIGQASGARTVASTPPRAAFASPSTMAPFRAGNRFFTVDATGTLRVQDGERGASRALLPAGSFSTVAPSKNGKYVAYSGATATSAQNEVRVRDVLTGRDLPDVLHDARISPAPWSHDEKGFLYVRRDSAGNRERVYYHGLGRSEANDGIILSQFDHPEWRYDARISDDGHYAVFTISYPSDSHTRIYFIDLADDNKPNFGAPVVKLIQTFDARYEFVDNAGSYFFLQTDRDAPLGRVVLANTDVIRATRWQSVVPETTDTLLYARTAGDEYVMAVYRTATGSSEARVYGPEDPSVLRAEVRSRMDSVKKARKNDDDRRPITRMGARDFMGNGPAIRLQERTPIPIPAGATIVAMNSIADVAQLFYTVKLSDGRLQSFMYDVKSARNEPFPATGTPAAAVASPSTNN
jgi:hypothetical protein